MMEKIESSHSRATANNKPPSSPVFRDFLGEKLVDCQLSGNKRVHSDSDLMISSREGALQLFHTKSGGETLSISPYDRPLHASPTTTPYSTVMLQQLSRSSAKLPRTGWSLSMNIDGGSVNYKPFSGQISPAVHQMPSSRFRGGSSCQSALPKLAAAEGSKTGKKGSTMLKTFKRSNTLVSKRNLSGLAPSGSNVNTLTRTSEPESSNSPRQMTIIFGGQLYVFDDVHPNKAEAIMALAGSDGGCWSTTLSKSSTEEATNGSCAAARENQSCPAGDHDLRMKCVGFENQGMTAKTTETAVQQAKQPSSSGCKIKSLSRRQHKTR